MTKRLPTLALYAAMILITGLITNRTASAQLRDDSGACGAQFSVCNNDIDPATTGGAAASVCRDSFGCLNCQATADMSSAVCARLYGSTGFCACSPIGMIYDTRYSRRMPRCNVSGSCAVR
jgi:hypothetical protein